jgi:hypothetical protein
MVSPYAPGMPKRCAGMGHMIIVFFILDEAVQRRCHV